MLILRDRLRHVEAPGQRDGRAGLGRTAPGGPSSVLGICTALC